MDQAQLDESISQWNNRPLCETVIDFKLPKGSTCIELVAISGALVCVFDVPDHGVVMYLVDKDLNIKEINHFP